MPKIIVPNQTNLVSREVSSNFKALFWKPNLSDFARVGSNTPLPLSSSIHVFKICRILADKNNSQ